jgi:hypothetical protein
MTPGKCEPAHDFGDAADGLRLHSSVIASQRVGA